MDETTSLASAVAVLHLLKELVQRDAAVALQGGGWGVAQLLFADADGVDDDEAVLVLGVGGDALELVAVDDAGAPAAHLLHTLRDLTSRMKINTSTGLMSVPVAIMSTVTAIRGNGVDTERLDQLLGALPRCCGT